MHARYQIAMKLTVCRLGLMMEYGQEVQGMRELAQDTVRTSINLARHILRYLTYQMSR
jgi:hypothetical protein